MFEDLKGTMLDFIKLLPVGYSQEMLEKYELMFDKLDALKRNLSE